MPFGGQCSVKVTIGLKAIGFEIANVPFGIDSDFMSVKHEVMICTKQKAIGRTNAILLIGLMERNEMGCLQAGVICDAAYCTTAIKLEHRTTEYLLRDPSTFNQNID